MYICIIRVRVVLDSKMNFLSSFSVLIKANFWNKSKERKKQFEGYFGSNKPTYWVMSILIIRNQYAIQGDLEQKFLGQIILVIGNWMH